MREKVKWYDAINFYQLVLLNEQTINWWSPLSLDEIKKSIAKEDFVLVTSGRDDYVKKEDISTKVIRSVKETTKEDRKFYKEIEEDFTRRLRLIRTIRKRKQPIKIKRLIRRLEKRYQKEKEKNQWDWYERDSGMHLDVLMYYNEDYLKKLLEQCEKIDLVS